MIGRRFSRTLNMVAFGLLLALAPTPKALRAAEGGTVPPIPAAPQGSSSWSDTLEVGLYALTLIY